jgi:hypothetical protein
MTFCFISFSHDKGNNISTEGGIRLATALKSNSSLTALDVSGNRLVASSFSFNTDNSIGIEGQTKLLESLVSNTSLVFFVLDSSRSVASVHSHTV